MPELYISLASVLCAAMLTIMVTRRITLGTAAGWVVLTCVHGLLIKPLFVYFDIPNATVLDALLFRGVSRDEYWFWGTVSLPAYTLFFISMILAGRYKQSPKPFEAEGLFRRYSNWRLSIFLLIALVGLVGFLRQFPDLLVSFSKNRIATAELADYDSGGVWRYLADCAYVVSVCAVVNAGTRRRGHSDSAVFVIAVCIWFPFCYLSDQRGLMLFSVVTYLIAYDRCIKRLTIGRISIAICGAIVLVLIKTITRLRLGGVELQETAAVTLGNLVGQNLIEHSKMISIIKAVPDQLNFQYGFSYLNSILVLIPRSLFPDKPFVNLDTTIGQAIFGCDAFGACAVPPGLLGESYLNFGVTGLFIMPILMGLFVGKLDFHFGIASPRGIFQIFYLITGLYLGMAILGSGISSSITEALTQAVLVAAICFVCQRNRPGNAVMNSDRQLSGSSSTNFPPAGTPA